MSKHTPGPWAVVYSKQGYPYQIDAPNGSDGPGGIKNITRWAAISFPSSTEGLANARLIAAAPDLLEALQLAQSIIGHPDDSHSQHIAGVIAKATGDKA